MARVEPVPDAPAATATLAGDAGDERALVIADYHAGIEAGLRYERGVELDAAADDRRERLLALLDRTDADRLIVLGDLGHRIGDPDPESEEGAELAALVDAVSDRGVGFTLVQGNHDAGVADAFEGRIETAPATGVRVGDVGFCHGHTWPAADVLAADVICVGHEHPAVKLEDAVGGSWVERAWLRGRLDRAAVAEGAGLDPADRDAAVAGDASAPELVVFPAFNDRSGGTWTNVEGQEFLAPFLPDAMIDAEAYLLDGTRLGDYRRV